jgi:hypothetical protein
MDVLLKLDPLRQSLASLQLQALYRDLRVAYDLYYNPNFHFYHYFRSPYLLLRFRKKRVENPRLINITIKDNADLVFTSYMTEVTSTPRTTFIKAS